MLLAKVDVEGAELGVLGVLAPLLPRVSHLVVELAPGWWPLYANTSERAVVGVSNAKGEPVGRRPGTVRVVGQLNRVLELPTAEATRIRAEGAAQVAALLRPTANGGAGFGAALTSLGKAFFRAERLRDYIVRMGSNGYWNQEDFWFARDATQLRRARRLICLRQQRHRSEHSALKACRAEPRVESAEG